MNLNRKKLPAMRMMLDTLFSCVHIPEIDGKINTVKTHNLVPIFTTAIKFNR